MKTFSSTVLALLLLTAGTLLLPSTTDAHELAPALLDLHERDGTVDVVWRQAITSVATSRLKPRFPKDCEETSPRERQVVGTGLELHWTLRCDTASLAGRAIAVDGLAFDPNRNPALLRWQGPDDSEFETLLTARMPMAFLPAGTPDNVAWEYLKLGVEHILIGADHLLFVLGLILLAHGPKRLLGLITMFTLGHSITLALVSLGVVTPPSAIVEWIIAASILLVALELARRSPGLLSRHPWPITLLFGLVHGMGFAGVLAELGLPRGEQVMALLSFNVGIEVGQLLFVCAVYTLWALTRMMPTARPTLRWSAIYLMGSVATYWCLDRALGGWPVL